MNKDNDTWIADLRRDDSRREEALAGLRILLLYNLRKALSHDARADDSFLQDVLQDSLLRILQQLDQFEGRSRFLTWATAISIRVAMTELRRQRWHDVSLEKLMDEGKIPPEQTLDGGHGPEAQVERKAVLESMYEIIQNDLTPKQQMVLLAELKGVAQEEIVRQLGSNRNAVYKLAHDARQKLRKGLETAGYRAEDILSNFGQ